MSAMKQITRSARMAGLTFGVMAVLPADAALAEAAEAPPGAQAERTLITTQGRGEVRVKPDSLRVDVGVEAQSETLEQARSEAARKAQRVIAALKRLRVSGLTLQTQTLQFYPVREAPTRDELPKIIGYRAVNSIAAAVVGAPPEELGDVASRIVDAGLAAGGTTAGNVRFFAKDVRPAQDLALQAAVIDAERNARAMAKAAGVTFIGLQSLDGSPSFQGEVAGRAFEALSTAPTPVVTGETVVSSSVTASFRFSRP